MSRRTLHFWIRKNNWDRIKQSAAVMPTLVAENCTLMIARLSENVLSEDRMMKPCTHLEANTMYKLALTAGKMKTRATLGENLEMLGFFMDRVNKKSPEMAKAILPFVEDYISSRAAININQLTPEHFNELGFIPRTEQDNTETKLDLQDIMEWSLKDKPVADIEQFRSMKDPMPTNPPADYFDAPKYGPSQTSEPLPAAPVEFPATSGSAVTDVIPNEPALGDSGREDGGAADYDHQKTAFEAKLEKFRGVNGEVDYEKYINEVLANNPVIPKLDTHAKFLKYQKSLDKLNNNDTNKAA